MDEMNDFDGMGGMETFVGYSEDGIPYGYNQPPTRSGEDVSMPTPVRSLSMLPSAPTKPTDDVRNLAAVLAEIFLKNSTEEKADKQTEIDKLKKQKRTISIIVVALVVSVLAFFAFRNKK